MIEKKFNYFNQSSIQYRADIDGLRAIAILGVVVFHLFPESLEGGFIGVDIFFVISGYLITSIIFKSLSSYEFNEIGGGNNSCKKLFRFLGEFYGKRVRRIFPALLFLLFGVSVVGFFVLTASEFAELGREIKWGSFFLENLYLIKHTGGYWDTATEMKPLMHLWTLAVEEQYYLIYPFICFTLWKFRLRVLPWLSVLFVISIVINFVLLPKYPVWTFFSLASRFWELLAGGLLSVFLFNEPRRSNFFAFLTKKEIQDVLAILGLLLIIYCFFCFKGSDPYPGWRAILPVTAALFLIFSSKSWINDRFLSNGVIVYIGLISYTWYLWHWPFLAMAREIGNGDLPSAFIRIILAAISLIFAVFSYYLVELPIRKKSVSMKVVFPLCLLLVLVGCGGSVINKYHGFPDKNNSSKILKTAVNSAPYTNAQCKNEYGYDGAFCYVGAKSKNRIAVVGDSHAFHLVQGFIEHQIPFVALAQHGTPPIPGVVKDDQEKWDGRRKPNMTLAFEKVIQDKNIRTVILAGRWDFLRFVKYKYFNLPAYKNKEERYIKGLEKGIDALLAAGKEVIIFRDTPEMRIRPSDCINTRLLINEKSRICTISKEEILKRAQYGDNILDAVKEKYGNKISIYSPIDILCPGNKCSMTKNNVFLYRDRDHLSNTGSKIVINDFLNKYPNLKVME